jgi:CRISPR-associated protein Csb2
MLTLDVDFLLGVCFAARNPASSVPDWPPQVDRVFSALVATWATRGEQPQEKAALEWLEKQSPPLTHASSSSARAAHTVFVPPNDTRGAQLPTLPARRRRQERHFAAAIPHRSCVSYSWTAEEPDPDILVSLQMLARDTAYLGHSASLVRCFFYQSDSKSSEDGAPELTTHRVYPGRLIELQAAFRQGRRPQRGETVIFAAPGKAQLPCSVFGDEWYVFADAGGNCPDLRQAAVVSRAMRTAIMSGFRGKSVPEVISGHTADRRPSASPHLAIFPLANIGWKWADGRLMGIALCLPRGLSLPSEQELFDSLIEIMKVRGSLQERELEIDLPGGGTWRLVRQPDPTGSSLKPFRYLRRAKSWATATPIALDRHPKQTDNQALQEEIATLIEGACVRIGLPKPRVIVPDKHSAIRGTAPARPSQKSPAWLSWALPGSLAGRVLTHATLTFNEPVLGPIALGAGRFVGLGICLPLDAEDGE